MKNLFVILSFLIFLLSFSSQSLSLPACPLNQNAFKHNCFGPYVWNSGDKYVGEWKNDNRTGQGTYIHSSGEKYIGEFLNNKRNGQGYNTWADGSKYVGQYKDNKRHGRGTFTWANGDKYEGEYKNDNRHGQGTYTWANGLKDVGEWQNSKLNGFAIRYDKKGNILNQGIWKDDKFLYSKKKSKSLSSNSKLDKYKRFCETIGFDLGTEKFADCVVEAMKRG